MSFVLPAATVLLLCGMVYLGYQVHVIHAAVNSNTQKMLDNLQQTQKQVVDLMHVNARIEMTLAEYKRQMGPLSSDIPAPVPLLGRDAPGGPPAPEQAP